MSQLCSASSVGSYPPLVSLAGCRTRAAGYEPTSSATLRSRCSPADSLLPLFRLLQIQAAHPKSYAAGALPSSVVKGGQAAVAAIFIFGMAFAASWNGLAWIICSEIYPLKIRGFCACYTAMCRESRPLRYETWFLLLTLSSSSSFPYPLLRMAVPVYYRSIDTSDGCNTRSRDVLL